MTPVLTCLCYIRALNGHIFSNLPEICPAPFPQHTQSLLCHQVPNQFLTDQPSSAPFWQGALQFFRPPHCYRSWNVSHCVHLEPLWPARPCARLSTRYGTKGDRRLSVAAVFELGRPGCAAGQHSVFAPSESLQQAAHFQASSDNTER